MRLIEILLVVFFLTSLIAAQQKGKIEGKIVQNSIASPALPDPRSTIQNKEVRLVTEPDLQTVRITRSDIDGRFTFESVAPGTYTLQVDCQYCWRGQSTVEGVNVKNGETTHVELELQRITVVEQVTVSAGSRQPIDEVSKTVNVLTAQEMRDRADFTLIDSLRTIPGFRVQQLGGFGKTANIKTRGLRNQDTAVLLDGVRFRDPSSITGDATPLLSDLTLTSVGRIEVLRGSGSSLYGTNAIGGVIDLQTPAPTNGLHGQVSGAAGGLGLGRFRANVSDSTGSGRLGSNTAVSRTVYTKGADGNDDASNTNVQGRVDIKPSPTMYISGRLYFSDAFVRLNSNPDTINAPAANFGVIDAREGVNFIPDVDDPDDTQRSRFFNGQIVLNRIISNELVFNGYYSGLATRRRNETGPLGVGFQGASTSFFNGSINTLNGHIAYARNSKNTVTAGYEFERETFGNKGLTPDGFANFSTGAAQSSHTTYVQDLVSLFGDRLQFAGGVRAQVFSLADPRFSLANAPYSGVTLESPPAAITFDGAASYFFRPTGTKVRAHIGSGYRVPSLFERFGTFFDNFSVPNTFVALGDPGLKPERSIAVDAGIEQTFEKVRLSAVFFYTKLIDTIGFGNVVPDIGTTPRPFGGYQNQKSGIARGTELSVTAKPTSSTDIFTSYTFTNSDQRQPQVAGSGVVESLGIPRHQLTLVATHRIKRFWASFDMLVASDYLAPIFSSTTFTSYVYRFRGNRRGDLTAGYNFALRGDRMSLRVFGTIENILNNRYFENGFRTPGIHGRAGVAFGF